MSLTSHITLILAAAGMTLLRVKPHHTREHTLKRRIQLEQAKYNTCTNCYRDYAYEEISQAANPTADPQKAHVLKIGRIHFPLPPAQKGSGVSQYTVFKCKYCGHTKSVFTSGIQEHHN